MLALKKKREAEAKQAKEEDKMAVDQQQQQQHQPEKLSLLGIGGKKKTKNGDTAPGKKRTPGEIRIQKGKLMFIFVQNWIHDLSLLSLGLKNRNLFFNRHCRARWRQSRDDQLSQSQ